MESLPMGSHVEVKLAMPVESNAAAPSEVEPLAKVTVPVGAVESAPDADVTVATNSTGRPCVALDGEADNITSLCKLAEVTFNVTELDVDAA